jgi:hypothetical protein
VVDREARHCEQCDIFTKFLIFDMQKLVHKICMSIDPHYLEMTCSVTCEGKTHMSIDTLEIEENVILGMVLGM